VAWNIFNSNFSRKSVLNKLWSRKLNLFKYVKNTLVAGINVTTVPILTLTVIIIFIGYLSNIKAFSGDTD